MESPGFGAGIFKLTIPPVADSTTAIKPASIDRAISADSADTAATIATALSNYSSSTPSTSQETQRKRDKAKRAFVGATKLIAGTLHRKPKDDLTGDLASLNSLSSNGSKGIGTIVPVKEVVQKRAPIEIGGPSSKSEGGTIEDACRQFKLGEVNLRSNNFDNAEACFTRALATREKITGKCDYGIAHINERLGDVEVRRGAGRAKAYIFYSTAVEVLNSMLKRDFRENKKTGVCVSRSAMNRSLARILLKKSKAHLKDGKSDEALSCLRDAIKAIRCVDVNANRVRHKGESDPEKFENVNSLLEEISDAFFDHEGSNALSALKEIYDLVSSIEPPEQVDLTSTDAKNERVPPVIIKDERNEIELLRRIGSLQSKNGEYKGALNTYIDAFDRMKSDDEVGNTFTYEERFGMCECIVGTLKKMGHFDKLFEWYNAQLEVCIAKFGKNHDVVATIYNKMGLDYIEAGRYEEAVKCFKKEGKIRVVKNDDKNNRKHTAAVLVRVGTAYRLWGQRDKALYYYRDALDNLMPSESRSATDTDDWLHQKLDNVEKFMGSVQVNHTEDFISGHTLTRDELAEFVSDMGNLFFMNRAFNEALRCYQGSLRMRVIDHPSDRQFMLRVEFNTAKVYMSQGLFKNALNHFNEILRSQKQLLGANHLDVANTLHEIGLVHVKRGTYNDAVSCLEKSLTIKEKHLHDDHKDVLGGNYNLAYSLFMLGDTQAAIAKFDEILSIQIDTLGEDHVDVARTRCMIGNIRGRMSQYDDALRCYEEALRARKASLGCSHPLVGKTLVTIASIHVSLRQSSEAEKLCEKAMGIYERSKLDETHPYMREVSRIMASMNGSKASPLRWVKAQNQRPVTPNLCGLLSVFSF